MKKKLTLFALSLMLITGMSAQDYQGNIFGVKAGYVSSWATSWGVTSSPITTASIGISDQIMLSYYYPFYLDLGLEFTGKGYAITGYESSKTNLWYAQIPVGISYHIVMDRDVTIEPSVCGYYAFGAMGFRRHNEMMSNVFSDGSTKRHDAGIGCGIAFIFQHVSLGVNYRMGLLDIDKSDPIYGDDTTKLGYKKLRNNYISATIGYNF